MYKHAATDQIKTLLYDLVLSHLVAPHSLVLSTNKKVKCPTAFILKWPSSKQ